MPRSFAARNVVATAKTALSIPKYGPLVAYKAPRWLKAVDNHPPPEILTRPIANQHQIPIAHTPSGPRQRISANLYKPQQIVYPEDELRRVFYKDHPWELARPRVIAEKDGRDARLVDWSRGVRQPGIALSGECVVQRQLWLMDNQGLAQDQAYDMSRREFYALRQQEEVERRVAQEEARMVGGYFGKTRMQVGMHLEDIQYEKWRKWAMGEAIKIDAQNAPVTRSTPDIDVDLDKEVENDPEIAAILT